jgi:ribosomal protein S15P/S13E
MAIRNIERYYQIENLLKHINDVYNHVKINKDSDKDLANNIMNGLLNEAYKEFYSMVEQSKTTDNILNYNDCLITLLAASSIDLCEAILYNSNDEVINNFYDRWMVLYSKTKFL